MTPATAAERTVDALAELHKRIAADLGPDATKAPVWRLHLPSGSIFTIRLIGVEGPLVRFTGFWASASTVDFVVLPPEAVVVTVETVEGLGEPLEFEDV